ncbi:MAG: peptidoglycan-binding protein [Candidatus Omnitrophica bacterium]|nr:peptidoglycan-binding protein [Candidatus Omnitrophota bacterium]
MRVFFILAAVVFLSGCVSMQKYAEERNQLESRVIVLETQLKEKSDSEQNLQSENAKLNEQINQIQQALQALKKEQEIKEAVVNMPKAKDIQTALKNAGYYPGEIDNKIGSQTKEAIKKFQEANDLIPDGVIGSRTWEKLSKFLVVKEK